MSEASIPQKIGFPEKLLDEKPVRLDVIGAKFGQYAAVNKPADMLFDAYSGAPKKKSVITALKEQEGKGELKRLGMESPAAVSQTDFEMSGAALLALNKNSAASMRNAIGSGYFSFSYIFLCRKSKIPSEKFDVTLPTLMHEERPIWIVSHRFGKKTRTSFELLEKSGEYELWSASASEPRPHQVRLHAAESGLKIVGERVYSKTPPVFMSNLKEEYKLAGTEEWERALYPHMSLHLSRIKFDGRALNDPNLGDVEISAELPKGLAVCLKRLGFSKAQI